MVIDLEELVVLLNELIMESSVFQGRGRMIGNRGEQSKILLPEGRLVGPVNELNHSEDLLCGFHGYAQHRTRHETGHVIDPG